MSTRKFKFVSPGVFLKEIDQSQLPKDPGAVGPVIIGRTRKGPALRPTKVSSYGEFLEVFGDPMPGGESHDPSRFGSMTMAPAYANYAAKAYFAANIDSPVTMVRLLGVEDSESDGSGGAAGYQPTEAFGLFVMPSASATSVLNSYDAGAQGHRAATLGAIFYSNKEDTVFSVGIKGHHVTSALASPVTIESHGENSISHIVGGTNFVSGNAVRQNGDNTFSLILSSSARATQKEVKISFSQGKNYLRDALNTNPVFTNTNVAKNAKQDSEHYWLGESFEQEILELQHSASADGDGQIAFVSRLCDAGTTDMTDFTHELTSARTGWVFGQNTEAAASFVATNQQRLFRLLSLEEGVESSARIIVAIEDIKIPAENSTNPFGTFSIVVKRIMGSKLEVMETFPNCNLNPRSQDFVARRIGDQYVAWSSVEKKNKLYGSFPNQSKYLRIEMDQDVEQNGPLNNASVPFGFFGPVVPKAVSATESSDNFAFAANSWGASNATGHGITIEGYPNGQALSLNWPKLALTISGSKDGSDYFGAAVFKKAPTTGYPSSDALTDILDPGHVDYIRRLPQPFSADQIDGIPNDTNNEYAWSFSLDDIYVTGPNWSTNGASPSEFTPSEVVYRAGSHVAGTAYTAIHSASLLAELGFAKFHMPLVGGFDGVDITEPNPFNNRLLKDKTAKSSYEFASVERAIEAIADPEQVEFNLAAMPGITNETLTTKLVQTCENRADSLAIIDLPSVYVPPSEKSCDSFADRLQTTPLKAAKALTLRQLNSSYGAAYYPWVKIRDDETSRDLWVPPSVIALGVLGHTEATSEVWFAPAGFNRGGLNEGNAGLPVLQTSEQLLAKQRDQLYDANINPIASFVTEGIVVFGQKTLQTTRSALDRINVRRLLIFVKKEVSRISNGLLFDQNVPATWNRFLGQVVPLLESVKSRLGLSDFRVVLDETTTTPDLIDRNIMYAKIFLKPARAIEFIAVDFVITNTGASFDD